MLWLHVTKINYKGGCKHDPREKITTTATTTGKPIYEMIKVVFLWQNEIEEYFHFLKIPSYNLFYYIYLILIVNFVLYLLNDWCMPCLLISPCGDAEME